MINDPEGQHYRPKCICPEVNTNMKFTDLNRRKTVQISRLEME